MGKDPPRTDSPEASTTWTCARKKQYQESTAKRVADRLTASNHDGSGRPGFEGIVVHAYMCTRCGSWHVGRGA